MIRLNKAIADAGICSRRKADELIGHGAVRVNGSVVTELGCKVNPAEDTIEVKGKVISGKQETVEKRYLMLHKPIEIVSTAHDPEGRKTVLDCLPESEREFRLYPVGRLDYFSEGLLLLTNDGELTHRLTHPKYHLPKLYEVKLRETPSEQALETMRRGMVLAEGERLAPVKAQLAQGVSNTLLLTLQQGVNRQVRRMCRDLNLTILKLKRIAMGPLTLGELPPGACRELNEREIAAIRKAVGLR